MQSIFLWILIARRPLRDIYDRGGTAGQVLVGRPSLMAQPGRPNGVTGALSEADVICGGGGAIGEDGEWKGDAELDAQVCVCVHSHLPACLPACQSGRVDKRERGRKTQPGGGKGKDREGEGGAICYAMLILKFHLLRYIDSE